MTPSAVATSAPSEQSVPITNGTSGPSPWMRVVHDVLAIMLTSSEIATMVLCLSARPRVASTAVSTGSTEFTPRPPVPALVRPRISDALLRVAAGDRTSSPQVRAVRTDSAPTATGSSIQGAPTPWVAPAAARCVACYSEEPLLTLINAADVIPAKSSTSSGKSIIAGVVPAASGTLMVICGITVLVR